MHFFFFHILLAEFVNCNYFSRNCSKMMRGGELPLKVSSICVLLSSRTLSFIRLKFTSSAMIQRKNLIRKEFPASLVIPSWLTSRKSTSRGLYSTATYVLPHNRLQHTHSSSSRCLQKSRIKHVSFCFVFRK